MVNCGTLDRTMVFDNSDGFLGVTYDAFGESTNVRHDPTNKKQFTGKEIDEDSGLYYFLARYYDPKTGRFISKDPVPGENLYVYCSNNPINKVDPDGRYEEDVHYTMTYNLALEAGFTAAQAKTIAYADNQMDFRSDTQPKGGWPDPKKSNYLKYHYGDTTAVGAELDEISKSGSLMTFGGKLHTYQDTYSHEGYNTADGHAFSSDSTVDKFTYDPKNPNKTFKKGQEKEQKKWAKDKKMYEETRDRLKKYKEERDLIKKR